MGDSTTDPSNPPANPPQKSLPRRLLNRAVDQAKQVPAHIAKEVSAVVGDVKHATRGDLDKVSLDTQIWLAHKAVALATGDKTVGLPLPVPGVPNLTIMVNFKDLSDAAKAKPDGFGLKYEVYRW